MQKNLVKHKLPPLEQQCRFMSMLGIINGFFAMSTDGIGET